jgi:toxin-antitoxin system PIN domain toxin
MMKTPSAAVDLLDVNVWLALADENHQHHQRAKLYWEEESAAKLAFCRVTMLSFLRLSTHPKVMGGQPFSASEAWAAYRGFRALPEVELIDDNAKLEPIMATLTDMPDFPHSRWTDSYLAAVALSTNSRLVSFDSDFHHFKSLQFLHLR